MSRNHITRKKERVQGEDNFVQDGANLADHARLSVTSKVFLRAAKTDRKISKSKDNREW